MKKEQMTTYAKVTDPSDWVLIDAENQTLGRLATQVATILQGKNKINYTSFLNTGDFVVVINVDKIILSGGDKDKGCLMFLHATIAQIQVRGGQMIL